VDRTSEYFARHPAAVALAFALIAGWTTYNAFYCGMRYADFRADISDHARAASEALGG